MKALDIQNRINEICTLFSFEYNGKDGSVDPYSRTNFLLFFDGEEKTVTSIDAVMNDSFFDGRSLAEIADDIVIIEW